MACKIVVSIIDELSKRRGLDLEEIIDDSEIYNELLWDLVEIVDAQLMLNPTKRQEVETIFDYKKNRI